MTAPAISSLAHWRLRGGDVAAFVREESGGRARPPCRYRAPWVISLATDYFKLRDQFSDEEWEHFSATRRFVDSEVLPAINEYWEAAELPWPLMRRLAELGLYGEDIEGYGCPGYARSPAAWSTSRLSPAVATASFGTSSACSRDWR